MFVSLLLNPKFENAHVNRNIRWFTFSYDNIFFQRGQIPNILDKLITCLVLFVLIKYLSKFSINSLVVGLLGGIGTFISGMVFLTSAAFIYWLASTYECIDNRDSYPYNFSKCNRYSFYI